MKMTPHAHIPYPADRIMDMGAPSLAFGTLAEHRLSRGSARVGKADLFPGRTNIGSQVNYGTD
jgi:hypothetical protein